MTDLDRYRELTGQELMIGSRVHVISKESWASDWRDDSYMVIGLFLNRNSGTVNITLDDGTNSGADGFTIQDIHP